jgi:hypothetical protein
MTRPGDGWDRYGEELLRNIEKEAQNKLNASRFPDSEWPNGRAFASQPVKPVPPPSRLIPENYRRGDKVLAVKKEHEPQVLKGVSECIEPIQGQYYDAFKGVTLKETEKARIKEYFANMFTGKAKRPIIVTDMQSRLSSDGTTLVSDAYHWMPIANAPLNTKLQLINRADGVANYGTITNANRHLFTHYAELPTFNDHAK